MGVEGMQVQVATPWLTFPSESESLSLNLELTQIIFEPRLGPIRRTSPQPPSA